MAESVILEKFSKLKPKKKFKGIEVGNVLLDFTPESHYAEINARRAKRAWIMIDLGIFAGCVVAILGVFSTTLITNAEVQASRIEKTQIQSELGKYTVEDTAISESSTLVTRLNEAAGGEVNWGDLINEVESALPNGTSVRGMSVNVDALNDARSATVLLSVESSQPVGYADTIKALESVDGITNLDIGQLSGGGSYSYSMTFDLDTSLRTYRFGSPNTGDDESAQEG